MNQILFRVVLISLFLTGCGSLPVATTQITNTPVPTIPLTNTSLPPTFTPETTATFTPEPTVTMIPTATPENQIFRDDFSGTLQPGWTWEHENTDRWSITSDGWLQILGEDTALLYGQAQSNLLWRELPQGDFVITVHLKAVPVANFQQATIYLYEARRILLPSTAATVRPVKPEETALIWNTRLGTREVYTWSRFKKLICT